MGESLKHFLQDWKPNKDVDCPCCYSVWYWEFYEDQLGKRNNKSIEIEKKETKTFNFSDNMIPHTEKPKLFPESYHSVLMRSEGLQSLRIHTHKIGAM